MTGPQTGPPGLPQHPWEQPTGYRPGLPGMSQPVPYTGPPIPAPAQSQPSPPGPASGIPQSGPYPVPGKTDWTYGLPPGVRPDLLRAPLGQHGAMAGSIWEQRGRQSTLFLRLITVELRKLVGTMSDRILLALAPLALVLATVYLSTDLILTSAPTTAAVQIFGLILACHLGPVLVYTVVLKTLSGEWHYRSVQLTLLLQPRRARYLLAQLTAVLVLWLVMALVQFGIYYGLKSTHPGSGAFQDYVAPRPLWVLGMALLAGFLTLLFMLCIGFLVRNPTAAVTVYLLLSGLYVFRVLNPPILRYVDPWQPATLYSGAVTDPLPAITSGALLIVIVVIGFVLFIRRDAR